MIGTIEKTSLSFENAAVFRKTLSEWEVNKELQIFAGILKDQGANKIGPMISTTYNIIKGENGIQKFDIEFIIPVDKEVQLSSPYRFTKKFLLTNAFKCTHKGRLEEIENTYKKMIDEVERQKLQQITPIYNVQVNEEEMSRGEIPVIDIYIGLNPNNL